MFSRMAIAPIAAAMVLAGVAPAVADYGVTTQNVRVGMAPAHVRHDIRQAARAGSVLFTQEMQKRRARVWAPAGWGTAQAARPRFQNRGDCATYWDRDVWRLRRAWVVHIARYPSRNGQRYALVTVLTGRETLAAVCVHLPTRKAPTGVRKAAFSRIRGMLERLSARFDNVTIGGDWNRPYRTRARFPGFVAGRPPGRTGAHGGTVDYTYTRRPARVGRVRIVAPTYSDHNGVRTWIRDG